MHREAFDKVRRVRDEEIREESQVQYAFIADQLTIKFGVTSKQYDQAFADHNLIAMEEVQKDLKQSQMPDDLQRRVIKAYN